MSEQNKTVDHPCRATCSGWKQGYDRGHSLFQDEMQAKQSEIDGLKDNAVSIALESVDLRKQLAAANERINEQTLHIQRIENYRQKEQEVALSCIDHLRSRIDGLENAPECNQPCTAVINNRIAESQSKDIRIQRLRSALRSCDHALKAAKPCVNGGEHMNDMIAENALTEDDKGAG